MSETKPQEIEKIKCPCCGEYTLHKPATIKSMILDEYMASIMSGIPFSHTYRLYNDSVTVTATELNKQDSAVVYTATQYLAELIRASEGIDIAAATLFKDLYNTSHVYSHITSIVTAQDGEVVNTYTPTSAMQSLMTELNNNQKLIQNYLDPDYEEEDKAAIIDLCKKLHNTYCSSKTLSSLPEAVIKTIVQTHDDIYAILLDTGFDSNFWTGIELA